jgi:hypothetical protein
MDLFIRREETETHREEDHMTTKTGTMPPVKES